LQQAKFLDDTLGSLGLGIARVINFHVDRTALLQRLTGRRTCKSCGTNYHIFYNPTRRPDTCDKCGGQIIQRSDDNEESVARRLDNFERATRPLLDYYANQGLLVDVDAAGQIYEVQQRVQTALRGVLLT